MKRVVGFALLALVLLLTSCGPPRWVTATYDQFPLNWSRAKRGLEPIKVIALVPGGGVVADAIGAELAKRGFVIIPMASTMRMVSGVDFKAVAEHYIPARRNWGELRKLGDALHARGADAFLIVRADKFDPRAYLGKTYWQEVHATLYASGFDESNFGGDPIASPPWFNIHDRPKTPAEAAAEIVENLAVGPGAI